MHKSTKTCPKFGSSVVLGARCFGGVFASHRIQNPAIPDNRPSFSLWTRRLSLRCILGSPVPPTLPLPTKTPRTSEDVPSGAILANGTDSARAAPPVPRAALRKQHTK